MVFRFPIVIRHSFFSPTLKYHEFITSLKPAKATVLVPCSPSSWFCKNLCALPKKKKKIPLQPLISFCSLGSVCSGLQDGCGWTGTRDARVTRRAWVSGAGYGVSNKRNTAGSSLLFLFLSSFFGPFSYGEYLRVDLHHSAPSAEEPAQADIQTRLRSDDDAGG